MTGYILFIWSIVFSLSCLSGGEGCSDQESLFIENYRLFSAMEQSATFWEQLCSDEGRIVVDNIKKSSEGCDHFWTDTELGDITIFRTLLDFREYTGDLNITCEVETESTCQHAWECHASVFDPSARYMHEGMLAFHAFYCRHVKECLQSSELLCPATTEFLRNKVVIYFQDGKTLTFRDLENKLIAECAKTDTDLLENCLGYSEADMGVCMVNPIVNQLEILCNYTDQTFSCLEEKCGSGSATFYINMFKFLRCGSEGKACGRDLYGDIMFEPVKPGALITVSCSLGQKGTLTRRCSDHGIWENVNDNCEWDLADLSQSIEELKNSDNLTDETVDKVLKDVKVVTDPVRVKKPPLGEIRILASDITIIMVRKATLKEEETSQYFDIISNTLDRSEEDWKDLINKGEGANTVLDNTDTIVKKLQTQDCSSLKSGNAVKFEKPSLDVTIGKGLNGINFLAKDLSGEETGEIAISAEALGSLGGLTREKMFSDGDGYFYMHTQNKLPLKDFGSGELKSNQDITFFYISEPGLEETCFGGVHYRTASSLMSPRLSANGTVRSFENGMIINSDVISVQLEQMYTNISPPVKIQVNFRKPGQLDPQCVFWDFSLETGSGTGAWSSEGCYLEKSDENFAICRCSHLTNFAVLMSLRPQDPEHALTLSYISAIGCFVSMLGLLATVICHGLVWSRVRSDRAVILMNFCCALFLALGVFLAGINRTESKVACSVIAGVLHLLFLVVFFLMLLKGLEILLCVVRLFTVKFPLLPLLIAAWGIPAVIVGISMVISLVVKKTDGYGYKDHCWLSIETGLIWAFVGPAALVILINFIVIIVVFRKMAVTTMLKGKSAAEQIKTSVRSLCVLLPLLGCTWVFGVLSVNSDLIVFQYLFCILNSLQGLFVFIFHCVYNQQLRDALARRRERKLSRSTLKTSFKSKSNSMDDSGNFQRTEKSFKAKQRKHSSDSTTSISSGKHSGFLQKDPFGQWEKGQRKEHQKDLRMQTKRQLELIHV